MPKLKIERKVEIVRNHIQNVGDVLLVLKDRGKVCCEVVWATGWTGPDSANYTVRVFWPHSAPDKSVVHGNLTYTQAKDLFNDRISHVTVAF